MTDCQALILAQKCKVCQIRMSECPYLAFKYLDEHKFYLKI